MKQRSTMLVGLFALVALVAVLAVAGSASAQGASTTTTCDRTTGQTIKPLSAPGQWDCTIEVEFPELGDPATFYTITISESSESWANPVISPSSIPGRYSPQSVGGEGGTVVTHDFSVQIGLTQNAPALQTTNVEISVSVSTTSQQPIDGSTTQLAVTPDYFNLYNVRQSKRIGEGGPQSSVAYPFTIDNFSNGQTRFEFGLLNEEMPAGFQAVVPQPVILQSQATGGETTSQQVVFEVYTPYSNGYVNEVGSIQLGITSAYATDTSKTGASSSISTLTTARGFYVPGPGAGLTGLAILGVGLLLTRRDQLPG